MVFTRYSRDNHMITTSLTTCVGKNRVGMALQSAKIRTGVYKPNKVDVG